jgi:hypothetical protein
MKKSNSILAIKSLIVGLFVCAFHTFNSSAQTLVLSPSLDGGGGKCHHNAQLSEDALTNFCSGSICKEKEAVGTTFKKCG